MTGPEEAIEAALAGCDQIGRILQRCPRRVTVAGPLVAICKAVRAWFVEQRRALIPVLEREISTVDHLYQELLSATGRASSQTSCRNLIAELRAELLRLRPLALIAAGGGAVAIATERAPSFALLAPVPDAQILRSRRWQECEACVRARAPLAAAVMIGGLLEAALLGRSEAMADKAPLYRAAAAPRNRTGQTKPLREWPLHSSIDVAHELGWISPLARDTASVLRDDRNFVHPAREQETGPAPATEEAAVLWEIAKHLVRQLLGA